MSLLNKWIGNLYSPTDTLDKGAIEDKTMDKQDVIDFLGDDDDDKDKEEVIDLKEKKDDKEEDDEDKEGDGDDKKTLEDEIEEDLEEVDEDKLELNEAPRRKEILAKYPNVFKDFPGLEAAYYREQKFSEIHPTIADAQASLDKSQLLDSYETDLMSGSTESILRTVRENDAEAFNRLVDNYLPNLQKVDEGSYFHIVGNIIKHTIASMVGDAKDAEEDDKDRLLAAASVVNEYIFGTKKYTAPTRLSNPDGGKKDSKTEELEERETEFLRTQFETHGEALDTKVNNILKATIAKNIDPKESMTDYVRNHATREAMDEVDELISKDTRFTKILDRLWEKAINDKFTSKSLDTIKSAYLSKAKTLLPGVIKKARNEALRGLGRRVDSEDKDKRGPLPVGKTRSSTSSSNSGQKTDKDRAKEIPKNMRTLDFLNSD